jgi:maltose phosphorylase
MIIKELYQKRNFKESPEIKKWQDIYSNMYFPFDENRNVFLQQDGFNDKEIRPASSLSQSRTTHTSKLVLGSNTYVHAFIKQADVSARSCISLKMIMILNTIRRNFDFYEPMTCT